MSEASAASHNHTQTRALPAEAVWLVHELGAEFWTLGIDYQVLPGGELLR